MKLQEGWYWCIGVLNLPQAVKVVEERGKLMVFFVGSSSGLALEEMRNAEFVPLDYPSGWEKRG
jgi:hypothetical protein